MTATLPRARPAHPRGAVGQEDDVIRYDQAALSQYSAVSGTALMSLGQGPDLRGTAIAPRRNLNSPPRLVRQASIVISGPVSLTGIERASCAAGLPSVAVSPITPPPRRHPWRHAAHSLKKESSDGR